MSGVDAVVAFCRARLDEQEAWAHQAGDNAAPVPVYTGSPEPAAWLPDPRPAAMLRDVAARRAIVDACERALTSIPSGHRADFARGILGHLASADSSHPDYDPAWAVNPTPYHADVWKP